MRLLSPNRRIYAVLVLVSSVVGAPALAQETPNARLMVTPQQIDVPSGDLTWTELSLTNSGGGTLTWAARVDQPWLRLAMAQERTCADSLAGAGAAVLQVRTLGHGLPQGTHEGHILVDGSGGAVTVSVTMTVRRDSPLDSSEAHIDAGAVPAGAWSIPFAVPVGKALTRPLGDVADQLRQQSGLDLQDVRVVAVTSQRVLYVAAENLFTEWGLTRYEARVWTSADGGATWSLLVHAQTKGDCYFSTRLQAAALHPDGERVFLGFTNGLFIDDRKVSGPSGLTNVDALHVSADGRFLYVATEALNSACGASALPNSNTAVYRGRIIAGSSRYEWEGGSSSSLLRFLVRIAGVGNDPQDPDVVYLRGGSGALFRKVLGPAAHGWQHFDATNLPEDLDFAHPPLDAATDYVRVPGSYAREYVPFGIDSHNAWAGFLIGRDGVAYMHYRGYHGGMYFDTVMGSRDAGVTWFPVWGNPNYGTWATGLYYLDARGFVGVRGSGSWTLDPIDPLTSFVSSSGGVISRTVNGGDSWSTVGAGLPGTRGTARVALDSLGTLYARFRTDVYARSVADHPLRVAQVEVEPAVLHRGGRAVVTARVVAWPPGSARPVRSPDGVRLQTEPDIGWTDLRDDGVLPDAAASDGVWSVEVRIPDARPYGFYAAIVAASTGGATPTRASARASYQVVPAGDLPVFSDGQGAGWLCANAGGAADVSSTAHVHAGTTALRVDAAVTCTYAGPPIHPFSRILDLWAFSPTGASALYVQDARLDSGGLPAGRWVHLSLPAEGLQAHPNSWINGGPDQPQPALLTRLAFRADAPVWLDQVVLLDAMPDEVPSAVTGPAESPLPWAAVLLPAYPNPFNSTITIPFQIDDGGSVQLIAYDILGQRVRILVDGDLSSGDHQVTWDGRDDAGIALGTGLYLCRLFTHGTSVDVQKVLLLR